jgi:hypothetical protein
MTVTTGPYSDELVYLPRPGTLYDVLDLILDRGMVIDIFIRVSLVGIEILKIDARIVVASVDTYLRFAEACGRINLENDPTSRTVPELFGGARSGLAKKGAGKAARSVGQRVKETLTSDDKSGDGQDSEHEDRDETEHARASATRHGKSRAPREADRHRSGTRTRARRSDDEDG